MVHNFRKYTISIDNVQNEIVYKDMPVSLLGDFEGKVEAPDSVTKISENYFSSLRTRSVVEPEFIYNKQPQLNQVPAELKMDFSRILNKPFFIKNATWTNTSQRFTIIDSLSIPKDIAINELSQIPFIASALYRAKVTLMLQVAGTPMHQGMLLAYTVPAGYYEKPLTVDRSISQSWVGSGMAAPHVFLSANESTPVALEVPFYVNGKLTKCDVANNTISPYASFGDYADLMIQVMNPLVAPTSGSVSLSVSVFAIFNEIEFYIPHCDVQYFNAEGIVSDLSAAATKAIDGVFAVAKRFSGDILDVGRSGVRALTGLHNPNHPEIKTKNMVVERQMACVTDKPVSFEKLDPFMDFDRITRDYIFDTDIDEMNLKYLLSKPQYIGNFTVNNTNASGVLCWSRPITPCQQLENINYIDSYAPATIATTRYFNQLQILNSLSRYWKGTIKLHIQAVMSNFHFCKLAVARDYSPVINALSKKPLAPSLQNLLVENLEFSAGGQIQTVELPYCSPLNQLPCTTDWELNASSHGIYYIYLTQPLVTNGSVSPGVEFNVYISAGDDFQFMGYSSASPMMAISQHYAEIPSGTDPVAPIEPVVPPILEFKAESAVTSMDVNEQKDVLVNKDVKNSYDMVDLRPIVSVRDYARRFYRVQTNRIDPADITSTTGLLIYDVAELLGFKGVFTSNDTLPTSSFVSTLKVLAGMYYGYSGGGRFKFVFTGIPNATAWYVPPGYHQITSGGDAIWGSTYPLNVNGITPRSKQQLSAGFDLIDEIDTTPNNRRFIPLVQCPTQERVNYSKPSSNFYYTDATVGGNRYISSDSCEVEVEIPNITPYRFIGDNVREKSTSTPSDPVVSYTGTSSLGHIVISIGRPVTTAINLEAEVDVFASVDDVARYGYQVIIPCMYNPGYRTISGNFLQMTTFMYPNSVGIQAPNCRPDALLIEGAYFSKVS